MSANSLQTGIWIVDKDSNMLFGMPVVPVTWCVLWAAINGFALTFGMCTIIYDKKRAPAAQIILAFLNCVYAPPWGPGAVWTVWSLIFAGLLSYLGGEQMFGGRIFGGMCACGIVVLGVFRGAAGDISPCGILPDTVFRMGYYVLAVLYVWSKPWENVRK